MRLTGKVVYLSGASFWQVASKEFPGIYPGEDHAWNLETFKAVSLSPLDRFSVSSRP